MPGFRYVAIDPAGNRTSGTMDAADTAEVIARLQRAGNMPVSAEPAGQGAKLSDLLRLEVGRRTLSPRDLTNLTRELAVMLTAGQDLDRALRFLGETATNKRSRVVLESLRESVRDGTSLSNAMAQHPGSFSRLYLGLIRAGETGGTLAPTLGRMAVLLERQQALISTITSAMIYPVLLLIVAIGSVTLLLTEVLPQFTPLFAQNGVAMPRSTELLITAGALIGTAGPYVLAALVIGVFLARRALQRPAFRLPVDRLLLRLPLIGGLLREVVAARFTRTLGTMVMNGVPLIEALRTVRDAVGNLAASHAIEGATTSARGGIDLSRSLEEPNVFPKRTIYLLRLGEETAQLGQMALHAAEIHEEATRISVQRLVALLVPVITIAMGAMIAGIVSSLLLAMLSLNDLAQ
jgi:general secretion pathway protein F